MQPMGETTATSNLPGAARSPVDAETRERLTAQHLPLVRRLCERYRYSGVAVEDLVQVGSIGLLKAINKFDSDRGTKFLAFAVPVIVGKIKNYFRDHGWAVKIPRKLQQQRLLVERAVDRLNQAQGRSPTVPEIAMATSLSEEEVYDTFEVGNLGRLLSLEAEYEQNGAGGASSFLDYLGSEDTELNELPEKIDLLNTVNGLDEREKTIVRLKFYSGLSQSEIAARLGISQMHVSRLQRSALGRLKLSLAGR